MLIKTHAGLNLGVNEKYDDWVKSLNSTGDLEDILLDVDAWEFLNASMCMVAAIIAAFLTRSWFFTLIAGVLAFNIGSIIQLYTYSDWLRRLFPLFIGSQPAILLGTLSASVFLFIQGQYAPIGILLGFLIALALGLIDILDSWMMPLRIRSLTRNSFGASLSHSERVFLELCERKLKQRGIEYRK